MKLVFEWNEEKNLLNIKKHEVDFREATSVFVDPLSITIADSNHSEIE